MSFQPYVTMLGELSDRIFGLIETTAKNADLEVTAQDARLVALSGMQESILSCGFWLNTYQNITSKDESMILQYAGSNISLKKTADIMLKEIKIGLVLFFHFKVENLFDSLLNKLLNKDVQGILCQFNKLASMTDLKDAERKATVIKAFSSIRNSLHNNGVHNKESFTVKIGGLDFIFFKDKPVECASLGHCVTLIREIIDILQEILESDPIRNIKGKIPETFSDWLETQSATER